jgi:hypothetical protein
VPTAWPIAKRDPNLFEQLPELARAVSVALRQYGCLLDERLAWALWVVAAKSADLQIDDCPPTSNW